MLKETLELLNIKRDHWYVDCNLGGGGHTSGILEKGGNVLGIDLDSESIQTVSSDYNLAKHYLDGRLFNVSNDLIVVQANFIEVGNVIESIREANLPIGQAILHKIKISGVLFDLGVSTHQLEKAARGFSFNTDAPLDMRMDQSKGVPAKDLVNGLYEKELAELFLKLGEESWSKPIAKKIVEYRGKKIIETTNELADIILLVKRQSHTDRTHPATQVFQALRIAVNDELNSLKEALPKAFEVLEPGGRIVVISFHSLEDRIVKNYFKELSSSHPREGGNPSDNRPLGKILTDKPIETSEEETSLNPRSRSAKLRTIEKL